MSSPAAPMIRSAWGPPWRMSLPSPPTRVDLVVNWFLNGRGVPLRAPMYTSSSPAPMSATIRLILDLVTVKGWSALGRSTAGTLFTNTSMSRTPLVGSTSTTSPAVSPGGGGVGGLFFFGAVWTTPKKSRGPRGAKKGGGGGGRGFGAGGG